MWVLSSLCHCCKNCLVLFKDSLIRMFVRQNKIKAYPFKPIWCDLKLNTYQIKLQCPNCFVLSVLLSLSPELCWKTVVSLVSIELVSLPRLKTCENRELRWQNQTFPFPYQSMVGVNLPAICSWTFNTYLTYHALTYHEPLADCEYILNLFLFSPENVKEIRFPSGWHNFNFFVVLKKDLFEPGFWKAFTVCLVWEQ